MLIVVSTLVPLFFFCVSASMISKFDGLVAVQVPYLGRLCL